MLVPVVLLLLLTGVLVTFAQEQITLTTYYPAPYGVYANLTVTDRVMMNTTTITTLINTGPGIWLSSPAPGVGQSQIVSFNAPIVSPMGVAAGRGLRIVSYSPGTVSDWTLFGHYIGPVPTFQGLMIRGDNQAFFTNDLTVFHDLFVLNILHAPNLTISSPSGICSDPWDAVYPGAVPGFVIKMPWRNKSHT